MNVSPLSKKNGMQAARMRTIGTRAFSNHGGTFGAGILVRLGPSVFSVVALILRPSSARRAGPTA